MLRRRAEFFFLFRTMFGRMPHRTWLRIARLWCGQRPNLRADIEAKPKARRRLSGGSGRKLSALLCPSAMMPNLRLRATENNLERLSDVIEQLARAACQPLASTGAAGRTYRNIGGRVTPDRRDTCLFAR